MWLVRALYKLTARLNKDFGEHFATVYKEDSVGGEVARMVLAEPCSFYRLEKRIDGGPPSRIYSTHQPRLSFRLVMYRL